MSRIIAISIVFALVCRPWLAAKSQSANADGPAAGDSQVVLARVPPKTAAEAMATFEVAEGFRIEQVAAEPLVVDPVAMAFDERGRLYVVEMQDYSEQDKERLGHVRLLTDNDGDGQFDSSQVFVDGLSWPTAVACFDGGVFIGSAPEILYCKDTDGDGKADEQSVVFSGFGRGNVQGLLNSFQWGLDGRIYGSTSSAGGQISRRESQVEPLEMRGRDFAFDPKTLEIEVLTGGGQHGMTFGRWGDRFVCHNSDHLQAIVFEERYLARNPYQAVVGARRSIAADGPQAAVFRASPVEAWRTARTKMRLAGLASGPIEGGGQAAGYFTSATGVTAYEGGLWDTGGEMWVLVADVGSNLIHRKRLVPDGVTYRGERIDRGTEFVRSTDIWFRPVQMAIGPEGALYVADMYREVIEHPQSLPPELKWQLDLTSGNDRGRIYRIVPNDYRHVAPRMLSATGAEELVAALDDPNAWRRATASRMLFERKDRAAIAPLRSLLSSAELPEGRIAAMYALQSAGDLSVEDLTVGMSDSHPQVRRHAVRLSEPRLNSSKALRDRVIALAADPEIVVRFHAALALGECDDAAATRALAGLVTRDPGNPDIVGAALTSIGSRAGEMLRALLNDEAILISDSRAEEVLEAVAAQIVRQRRDEDLDLLIGSLRASTTGGGNQSVATLLRAVGRLPANVFRGSESHRLNELRQMREAASAFVLADSRQLLEQGDADMERRIAAIGNLALGRFEDQQLLLETLLSPQQPTAIRAAALRSCGEFSDPEVAELVLERWQQLLPDERALAAELLLRREAWTLAMLRYLKEDGLPLATLEPAQVAKVRNHPSSEVRDMAGVLSGQTASEDRKKVFDEYREVVLSGGDPTRGKSVFEKNCATCHELAGRGQTVGPNLAAMVGRGAESILFNILAPSAEVEPRYMEYVVVTADGQVVTGMIAGETSTSIVLRGAENKTTTVLRVDIDEMQSTGKSLMPEGFEKAIDKNAMADLLAFLQETAAGTNAR